jgi:hypothetical protein
VGLVGRDTELSQPDLQAFTDFALALMPPPNPVRNLDDSLTPDQAIGENIYFTVPTDSGTCDVCHRLDPAQNFFGTGGGSSFEGGVVSQEFKIPHLRNMYQKVGMFGSSFHDNTFTYSGGPQIRGFGYLHDGAIDTLDNFFAQGVFNFPTPADVRRMSEFNMVIDSNLKPVVGQQVTLTGSNGATVGPRIDLLIARGLAGDCDLLFWTSTAEFGVVSARQLPGGQFRTSVAGNPTVTDAFVRTRVGQTGEPVTYTCAPPGSGVRMSQVP